MGIPFLKGRTYKSSAQIGKPDQAVISASFARQYLASEDPIGKHIQVDDRKYEIVGVVGDVCYSAAKQPEPIQYVSLYDGSWDYGTLVVRSDCDVEQFALPVQRIVQSIDRDLPVSDVLTMDQLLGNSARGASVNATLLTVFAMV